MKKLLLSLAVLSAFGAAAVQAEPTVGASGNLIFNGSINADTCVVSGTGVSSSGANLLVDMGAVSSKTLGTEANPATSAGGLTTISKDLGLQLECVSGTSLSLKLTPTQRLGKGIAVTGGATNVQIMLVNNDTVLDFTSGSATVADIPFAEGKISVPVKAYYTLAAGKNTADVKTGPANATVAYELSYE